MKPEVKAFLDDILEVCKKHAMVIVPEAYDCPEVWPIDENGIETITEATDRT